MHIVRFPHQMLDEQYRQYALLFEAESIVNQGNYRTAQTTPRFQPKV